MIITKKINPEKKDKADVPSVVEKAGRGKGGPDEAGLASQKKEDKQVIENRRWLLARHTLGIEDIEDSREILEEAGFEVLKEHDDWYYEVKPPKGWKLEYGEHCGEHIVTMYDEKGQHRAEQVIGKNSAGEYAFVRRVLPGDYYEKYR